MSPETGSVLADRPPPEAAPASTTASTAPATASVPTPATAAVPTPATASAPAPATAAEQGERLRVLDARASAERSVWERAWEELASGDVFSHPAYLEQFAQADEIPLCALFTGEDGGRVLYAFLRRPLTADGCGRPVPEGWWDVYTALLYGGPLTGDLPPGADPARLLSAFWASFRAWARSAGAVSEFIRTDPADPRTLSYPGTVREQAPHVVRDLRTGSLEALRADMRSNVRRGVARARAEGLTVVTDTDGHMLADFMRIYAETMDRAGAAPRFRYPPSVFRALHAAFPGRFAYVYAMDGAHAVAVELMLFADEVGYFFLGGTETAALRRCASVLVHWEAIALAWERGLRAYVLTGGVTNTPGDSLLRFKRSFAPQGSARYLTAQQVFHAERYARLLCPGTGTAAEAGGPGGAAEAGGWFPAYRAPCGCEVVSRTLGEQSPEGMAPCGCEAVSQTLEEQSQEGMAPCGCGPAERRGPR